MTLYSQETSPNRPAFQHGLAQHVLGCRSDLLLSTTASSPSVNPSSPSPNLKLSPRHLAYDTRCKRTSFSRNRQNSQSGYALWHQSRRHDGRVEYDHRTDCGSQLNRIRRWTDSVSIQDDAEPIPALDLEHRNNFWEAGWRAHGSWRCS